MDKNAIAKLVIASATVIPDDDRADKTPVNVIPKDVLDKAVASKPFQDWLASVGERYVVKGVKFQSVDMFGPRVGFIKFVAEVTDMLVADFARSEESLLSDFTRKPFLFRAACRAARLFAPIQ